MLTKQSIRSLRWKPTFPHYFQHTLVLITDRRLSTYPNQSKVLLMLPAELWALSQFLIAHTVAQGFSRYLQISGDILGWVPVLTAGNIWFTSTNGGATGLLQSSCDQSTEDRMAAEVRGCSGDFCPWAGILQQSRGAWGPPADQAQPCYCCCLCDPPRGPCFRLLPFLKSTQHNR